MNQLLTTKFACLAALLACLPAACVTTPDRTTTQRFHDIRIGASEAEVEALLGAPLIRYASAEPPLPASVDAWYLPPPPLGPVDSPWGPGSIVVTYESDGRVVGKRLNPHVRDPESAAANAAAERADQPFRTSSWVGHCENELLAAYGSVAVETGVEYLGGSGARIRYFALDDDTQIGFHLDLAGTVLEQGNPEPRTRWARHGGDSITVELARDAAQ